MPYAVLGSVERRAIDRVAVQALFKALEVGDQRRQRFTDSVWQSAMLQIRDSRIWTWLERQFAGDKGQDIDLIFATHIGTPVEDTNLVKLFKSALRQAGLPEIRFHDLRHTAATLMLLQGVHPKVVQERLGHSTIGMTLDIYSHVLPSMQEDVADKMDEMFTPLEVGDEPKKLKETSQSYDAGG